MKKRDLQKTMALIHSEVFFHPEITQRDVCRRTGLSAASISTYISKMRKEGIILPEEGEGCRNVPLRINPTWRRVLGVDIGSFFTRLGLLMGDGTFSIIEEFKTPEDPNLLYDYLKPHEKIADYIGVGVTAVVDSAAKKIFIFPNQRRWDGFSFQSLPCGKRIWLTSSGKAAATYEKRLGKLQNEPNCIHVNIGSSIQSGLFINDSLVEGSNGAAGELGHVFSLAEAGQCTCGNVGCLENVATLPIVLLRLKRKMASGMQGVLSLICKNNPDNLTVNHLSQAITENDPQALAEIRYTASAISNALSGLVNVLNPGAISFGGSMVNLLPSLVDEVRSDLRMKILSTNCRDLSVLVSSSPIYGACHGAAVLQMENLIRNGGDFDECETV